MSQKFKLIINWLALSLIIPLTFVIRLNQLLLSDPLSAYPFSPTQGKNLALSSQPVKQRFRLPFAGLQSLRLALKADKAIGQSVVIKLEFPHKPPVMAVLPDQQLVDNYFTEINLPQPMGQADDWVQLTISTQDPNQPSEHINLRLIPQADQTNPIFAVELLQPADRAHRLMFAPKFVDKPSIITTSDRVSLSDSSRQLYQHLKTSPANAYLPWSIIWLATSGLMFEIGLWMIVVKTKNQLVLLWLVLGSVYLWF